MIKFKITATSESGEILATKEIQIENDLLQKNLKNKSVDIAGIYYSTYDYSKFEHIKGNSEISESDIKRVAKGYDKCGYMTNPIAVTSDMSVFDGEKRLTVHKENGWPVEFTVIDERFSNKDVMDIITINNSRKNRDIHDIIHKYAVEGDESYIRLEDIDKKYSLNVPTIYCVLKNIIHNGHLRTMHHIKEGKAVITQEEVNKAIPFLDFLIINKKYFSHSIRKDGNDTTKFSLLAWCYRHPDIDQDRFTTLLEEYVAHDKLSPMTDIDITLDELSSMYNYKKKTGRVDFRKDYNNQVIGSIWKNV